MALHCRPDDWPGVGGFIDGELRLPSIFSDRMVIQQGETVPLWGWASPNETLTASIAGQVRTAVAGGHGTWHLEFDPISTLDSLTLTVAGDQSTLVVEDVLAGEVWLCAGQSNMQMDVASVDNAMEAIQRATHPGMRMFRVKQHAAPQPQDDIEGEWVICSPQTVGGFSAVAYFFGQQIHQYEQVPVGLIEASWSGTLIEAWTSLDAVSRIEVFQTLAAWLAQAPNTTWDRAAATAEYQRRLAAWKDTPHGPKPNEPIDPRHDRNVPGNLFNGMIHPLAGFALRGVIWYQGEQNASVPLAHHYADQLSALIDDWRSWWRRDFPFGWVQLPEFGQTCDAWPTIRDGQNDALRKPRTGMAVGLQLGACDQVHPPNKVGIADRLSRWALADVYDHSDIPWRGPTPVSYATMDSHMRISFEHTGGNLCAINGKVTGFILAGDDRNWINANADIIGDDVVVYSVDVPHPVAVRYAWEPYPKWSLLNAAGLPASPFRSDDWCLAWDIDAIAQPNAEVVLCGDSEAGFLKDGWIDETAVRHLPVYHLMPLKKGRPLKQATSFQTYWHEDAMHLTIRCEDDDMEGIEIATMLDDDENIWYGDCVEVILVTQAHSYYQLAIGPTGALVDIDRRYGPYARIWQSDARVQTHMGGAGWVVNICIPLSNRGFQGVSGERPSAMCPWYFNVARQRVRLGAAECATFASNINHFHDVQHFAKLI